MQFSGAVQICEGFNIELTYFLKTLSLNKNKKQLLLNLRCRIMSNDFSCNIVINVI